MVDTQVRPSDVTKFPIIDAMLKVARENYVPVAKREAAYLGENLELGEGRIMLEPRTLAKMLDALAINGDELVLEVKDDGPGVVDIQKVDAAFDLPKGVGISNIRNRLQGIYAEEHSLTFSNAQPSGLIVRVVIPYDTK